MKLTAAFLALTVCALVALGLGTLASISSESRFVNQGMNLAIAMFCAVPVFYVFKSSVLTGKKATAALVTLLIVLILIGLAIVHVPGLSRDIVKGAVRWIYVTIAGKRFSFQPSEVVKVAFIVLLAWWMQGPARKRPSHLNRVFKPFAGLGFVAVGFYLQSDYGSIIMLSAVAVPVMLLGGAKFRHAIWYCVGAVALLAVLIATNPTRLSRIESFWNPEKATPAERYQIEQSHRALTSGGAFGVGYGDSIFKNDYLPENHTDFVFAMIGEEWGFAGSVSCLVLYMALLLLGLTITAYAPDLFSALISFGLTLQICLAAGVNIGMVAGMLPTKGLALPFISYGGSNLLCSIVSAVILISICLRCKRRRLLPV